MHDLPASLLSQTKVYGLQGTGGCARGIMPLLKRQIDALEREDDANSLFVFIESLPDARTVNGYPVISDEEFLGLSCAAKLFNIGIANSAVREKLYTRYTQAGIAPISIISDQATIYGHSEIGEGVILCPNTTVTTNVRIGKMFQGNLYSYVEHDCVIGDFVTFAPGVHCNGSIRIEDHAYIGTGATIKQGTLDKPLVIGRGATVGMGAVVTRDVPPNTTVVGNPARPLQK